MPKSSRQIIKILTQNGWVLVRTRGSHHQFKHEESPENVTVPHPKKDMNIKTIRSIEKQSGLKIL